jgi:glycine hydroxymethyltransferase
MTTRGFKEPQAVILSNLIADLLDAPEDVAVLEAVKSGVAELTKQFPVYSK